MSKRQLITYVAVAAVVFLAMSQLVKRSRIAAKLAGAAA